MRQMGERAAVRAALATSLFAACIACSPSSAEKAGPTATVATEVPTTATTNPYAVPPVIDAAYVNRVLAGLDALVGDVTRLVVSTHTIPREAYDRLRASYDNDERLQLAIDSFQSDLRSGMNGYRRPPGDKVSTATKLIDVLPACIFVQVNRDYSAVGTSSSSSDTQWIALRPLETSRDMKGYNKTSWAFSYEGYTEDRKQPPNPCAG